MGKTICVKAHFHFIRNLQFACNFRIVKCKHVRIQYTVKFCWHEFSLFLEPMKFAFIKWREDIKFLARARFFVDELEPNMTAFNRKRLLLLLLLKRRIQRKANRYKKRFCTHPILKKRKQQGEYANLVREMQLVDHKSFFKYFRMSPATFEKLLRFVAPKIVKSSQKREAVSPAERLSVRLRYLATGDSHQTIAFSYWLGHSTVNRIIP